MAETVNIAELKLHQVWVCVAIDTYWILNSSVKIESVTTQKPFHQQLSVFFKKSTDLVLSEAQLNFRQYKKFNCKNRSQSTVTLLNSSPFRVWNIKSSKQCQWKIVCFRKCKFSHSPRCFCFSQSRSVENKIIILIFAINTLSNLVYINIA